MEEPVEKVVAFPHQEVTLLHIIHCCIFVARGCVMSEGVLPDQQLAL